MSDPRTEFVAALDLAGTRIGSFPAVVFFCGGPLNPGGVPRSLRDYLLRWINDNDPELASRVVLAEKINGWMKKGTFTELFTLEQYLAALASVIVITLESPGSIAELGAFSALPGVQDKLLVFIRQQHHESESFIRLGPIDFLSGRDKASVAVYPWQTNADANGEVIIASTVDDCIAEMHGNLKSAAPRVRRTLNPTDDRDRMLLVADLVSYLIALQENEVEAYLRDLGVVVTTAELRRYLFVLECLGIVRHVTRGHNHYYIATREDTFLKLSFRAGHKSFDRARTNVIVGEYYREHDAGRGRAVASALAGLDDNA